MLLSRILPCCLVLAAGCQTTSADAGGDIDASAGQTEEDGGGTGSGELFGPIIDNELWQVLDAADDPLAAHRPDPVECGLAGWYIEESKLEIDTNNCNYLALHQPSLVPIAAGQQLQLIMYHFDLVAPEPALAHVEILVDGEALWEQSIEIPGDAQVYTEPFASPLSAPAGAEVVFHLHNHGQNTWVLQELVALP